jgi:hypothetical protein
MSVFDSGRNRYAAGIGSVGAYQMAGIPWITGSTSLSAGAQNKISFPAVAKTVTIINDSAPDIRIHFAPTGSGNVVSGVHYVTLTATRDSLEMGVRCKEVYISAPGTNSGAASYTVFAELTGIEFGEMPSLTGSGITE